MALSMRWASRSRDAFDGARRLRPVRHRPGRRLPRTCARAPSRRWPAIGFEGYAVGGLAVGEGQAAMFAVLDGVRCRCCRHDRPRYLMGVGTPDDILAGGGARDRHVRLRDADAGRANGARLHQSRGVLNLRNARHQPTMPGPLDDRGAPCTACTRHSPRLPAPPVPRQRDAGADVADSAQPDLLPIPDARLARGHRGRAGATRTPTVGRARPGLPREIT